MGYGEYSGNQSVHWSVVHHNGTDKPGAIRGRDPIKFEEIGVDAARGLTPGKFRVPLAVRDAGGGRPGAGGRRRSAEDNGNYFLVFDVPAVNRAEGQGRTGRSAG